MSRHSIDLSSYKRRDHFEHFLGMDYPFVSMTVQLDITDWFSYRKEKGYPFFLSLLYLITKAANRIPELRQRIVEDGIVQYDWCQSSFTVALEDETYRYCVVPADLPFDEYLKQARILQEEAKQCERLADKGDPLSYFYVSSVPWASFSSISLPAENNRFSVPCITPGKYYSEEKVVLRDGTPSVEKHIILPLSIMVNHAIVDGRHIARFYTELEDCMRDFIK